MTRRAMTKARKARIHTAAGGVCYHCHLPVDVLGPGVRYDHYVGVWFLERDKDHDVMPAHTACDAPKTAADATRRAKTKREMAMRVGAERKPSTMRSRPFPKGGPKRTIQSRGFR